ncbi:hypothetical protein EA187_07330 [Lujinxingia sediminis]|uniref:Uncharacterized protein n=1 Tax=Lujinxingia sediminis TaxID=2480984 RepID=A0ABY0CWE8_9DELT|nr:hypothetical protein [Lujinxingia sediminis]RVU46939.1 hypothetical protein EA187_07330 [Lujinxingia sediminis]
MQRIICSSEIPKTPASFPTDRLQCPEARPWRATLERLRILTARHTDLPCECPHRLDHLAMDGPHQQRSLPALILRHARALSPPDRHWLAALTTAHLDLFTIEGLDGTTPIARHILDDALYPLLDWEDDLPLAPGQLLATRQVRSPSHPGCLATSPIRIPRALADDLLAALWRALSKGPHRSWRPFMRDLGARILLSYLHASPPTDPQDTPIPSAEWAALEDAFHRLESAIFNGRLSPRLPANLGFGRQARILDLAPGPILLVQHHGGSAARSPWLRARRADPHHLDPDALDALLDAGLNPSEQGAIIVEATDLLGHRRDLQGDDLRALTAACLTLLSRAPFSRTSASTPPQRQHPTHRAA